MTTAAAKAAARRKKAKENQASGSSTPAPKVKSADELRKALPTTKLYPKRIPLEVSPEAHERLRRLSYELNKPVNMIIRALIDSSSDEKVREALDSGNR